MSQQVFSAKKIFLECYKSNPTLPELPIIYKTGLNLNLTFDCTELMPDYQMLLP